MRKLTILIWPILVMTGLDSSAQGVINPNELNAYRYIEIDPPTKASAQKKRVITKGDLRLTSLMEELFQEQGFLLVPRDSTGKTPSYGGLLTMPRPVQLNGCLNLRWYWGFSQGDRARQVLKVMGVNCLDEIVFENSYKLTPGNTMDFAIRTVLAPVIRANYHYDEQLNYRKFIPSVIKTDETESSLRKYFTTQPTDALEGIYKSIDNNFSEDPAYYKIGIKKINGRYQMIVIETDNEIWNEGEVKGYLEKSESTSLFPSSFYLSDKRKTEGFAELNDIILTISLTIQSQTYTNGGFIDGDKTSEMKFIKIYSK